MPSHVSDDRKEAIFNLMLQCNERVEKQVPIGIYYNGIPRIVAAHSLFLQKCTPDTTSEIVNPSNIYTRMKFYNTWARRAISIDADQILSTNKKSLEGWKTLHLDKVDDARIMTIEEIYKVFQLKTDKINDNVHLIEWFAITPDFVRNWNYWFRIFFAQVPSKFNLK